jgi:hypothetical protein
MIKVYEVHCLIEPFHKMYCIRLNKGVISERVENNLYLWGFCKFYKKMIISTKDVKQAGLRRAIAKLYSEILFIVSL